MKDVVGIAVPSDRLGVLQDVHWSGGMIGYFPTYTLGNLYSAQFFAQATKDVPRLIAGFRQGKFAPLLNWLRANIHLQGKRHSADELAKRVTGSTLSSAPFLHYLEEKMANLYDL